MVAYPFDMHSLIKICRKNDVTSVSLFGSMARGEATEKSDIDLLVKFGKRKSLLSVVKLERQLAMALGRNNRRCVESLHSRQYNARFGDNLCRVTISPISNTSWMQ
jgi:hypothetical protein